MAPGGTSVLKWARSIGRNRDQDVDNNFVDQQAGQAHTKRPARISVGLRNVSRTCRREILRSFSYHELRSGAISRERYARFLHTHLAIRRELETLLASHQGTFRVLNIFEEGEEKLFSANHYVTPERRRSVQLQADLLELTGAASFDEPLPAKAAELIDYMGKVSKVYSAALLGVLYMLEETAILGGPGIAGSLDVTLGLGGGAQRYLGTPGRKADLWRFRRSLDLITDPQTQINIVTAGTVTYQLYQDLLDSWVETPFRYPGRVH